MSSTIRKILLAHGVQKKKPISHGTKLRELSKYGSLCAASGHSGVRQRLLIPL